MLDAINAWEIVAEGVQRRIRVDGEKLMVVEVQFQPGAVGVLHQHVHEQATYIASGRVTFTVGDEKHELAQGQMILVPSNVVHGCVAHEATTLLDSFSPPREDFRK